MNSAKFANIPQELKARRQWVCYRIEFRDGRKTKIPYRTDKAGGGRARSNDSTTWHSFEEVVSALAKPKNRFDGIGFILSESDPYTFIDLDHVVSGGAVEEWAQEIVDKVKSYTEFSQSGAGIHIFARARKPGPRCRTHKHPKFEIYDRLRLVVFTGKLLPGSPPQIRGAQKVVDEIYFRMFADEPRSEPKKAGREFHPILASDRELVDMALAASNGGRFRRLWSGDTSEYGGDDSAADMALCCSLAFWTRKDPERMDRLFRMSGLMRPKWDEKRGDWTYGRRTIDAAIERTTEVYDGRGGVQARRGAADEQLTAARARIAQARNAGSASAVFEAVESLALLPPGEYADAVKKLKEAVPQLDLRELKKAVARARKSKFANEGSEYPQLVVSNRQLRDMGDEAVGILERSNAPPTLFVRSGALCEVVEDERGRPIIRAVTEDVVLARLAKTCNSVVQTEDGLKNVLPPRSIASYILAQGRWPFPPLEAVTCSPTIRQDGSIAQVPGYDSATRLYYHRTSDEPVNVPDKPTSEDVVKALGLLDELLHDFPFDCQASKANAIALLLSPIIQPAVMDLTPLFLIDAPTAGSGKSLLAITAGIISSGAVPDFTTAPSKDEEWPKKITAILTAGPSLVVIDNVKHTIQSAELAMLLTTRAWKERVFGKNTETVILPNRAVWVATGNNIQIGGDIPRRCVWIRIDPRQSKPHQREGFLHPNLIDWTLENRASLLAALLVLCRAWYADGSPEYPVPVFGSFEKWTHTVGGILGHAGVEGFLANRDQLWEQSDAESAEWEAFLSKWHKVYGSKPITPKELVRAVETGEEIADALPAVVSDALCGKGDRCSRIGKQFRARLGKRYGKGGFRLERGARNTGGVTWVVEADDAQSTM